MKIPLDKITILPGRQRHDLGPVESDLMSMADPEVRLIEPIIVERMLDGTYNLIAGERRTRKARFLGWTDIEAVERNGIDEVTRQKIEYAENVERKDLYWTEKCLAVFRLYKLENRIRKSRGEDTFSIRAMASFSGYTKSSIGYMIQIGDALSRLPKDEEMWATENYTKAIALLLERTEKALNPEREKHQAIANATQFALPQIADGATISPEDLLKIRMSSGEAFSGHVQQMDTTQEAPTVYIHGRKMRYEDDKANKLNLSHCILAYGPNVSVEKDLHPAGYAVLWGLLDPDEWLLVWNHVNIKLPTENGPIRRPFIENYTLGCVLGPFDKIFDNPQGCVISAVEEEDNVLPAAVVEYSIRQLAGNNMPVVVPCGVNPVHIAELGRVPIWYEPVEEKYNQKVAALIAHYEANIPGVKCVVKG